MADWTLISGSTPQDYTDTAVFEVNPDTKQIALITGQALADTRAAIAADSATTTLNITRVISTTYMTDTQLARITAWKKRNMLFFKFNAEFTGTGYTVSDFTTIARISGWSALSEVLMTIPNQTDGTKLLTLFVKSNGEVQVYSPSPISGFYIGYVCVPYSG